MKAINIENIEKSFKDTKALHPISLSVDEGEIFGLIGPDGAGKTTLIRILTTLLIPDKGTVTVNGLNTIKDYKKLRHEIGYMPGRFSLYLDLTVEENLNLFATIFGTTIDENYHLIAPIYSQIEEFKKRPAGKLSGGMKQKLALSCALIHKPKVLFLDEPTTGVDPVSRKELWDMLKSLKKEGLTIFVSTPYMDEAILCDRVALIQEGKLLAVDSPDNIIKLFPDKLFSINAENTYLAINALQKYEFTHSVYPFGENIHFVFKDKKDNPDLLKKYLESNQIANCTINEIQANIEDCFMEMMVKR